MRPHYLSSFFAPQSVAVIGVSERPDSIGAMILRSLSESGYRGKVHAVNPHLAALDGVTVYPSVADIPEPVDLAIVATPKSSLLDIVAACGARSVPAAIVMTGSLRTGDPADRELELELARQARRFGVRLMGPNSLGVMRPSIGLNAPFVRAGPLALVSQSVALAQAILDWAAGNDVGFSAVVSTGDSIDVDLSEVLDFLVSDAQTESILLHIEEIHKPRFFMSALRAAARVKPVIALKSRRHRAQDVPHGAADDAFDTALRRAGVVRVNSFSQLFSAAKACSVRYRPAGDRIAIVSNGHGPARLAADRAADLGLPLAALAEPTLARLSESLPEGWSRTNPVNLTDRANETHYRHAVAALLDDPGIDGVIVLLSPQAMSRPIETATATIESALVTPKPLLACWMGDLQVVECRRMFSRARVPNFRTPESAIEAYSFISAYQQSQRMLLQTPPSLLHHDPPDIEGARLIVGSVLEERRRQLSDMEAKALLTAFRIPVTKAFVAHSANEAMIVSQQIGFPVALKIDSPDIEHKADVGGVRLNVANAHDMRAAYKDMLESVGNAAPQARIEGVAIEAMVVEPTGREIVVGILQDDMFGPVIYIGAGGTTGELLSRRSVALPPLNAFLAADLVSRSDVAKLLQPYRSLPAVDFAALQEILLRISELACEMPEVRELSINPLIVHRSGALAVDARVVVAPARRGGDRYAHMAIHPYPSHLETHTQLRDGTDITIRPIRPEDAEKEQAFVRNLSDTSRYFRFMDALRELPRAMLARFTQIDYDREMALVAVIARDGAEQQIGVARYVINPDAETCEFALAVSDAWHGRGIGSRLMGCLMDVARTKGLRTIEGEVLANNQSMLKLMTALGFRIATSPEDRSLKIVARDLSD
jgi:acetyltransferase